MVVVGNNSAKEINRSRKALERSLIDNYEYNRDILKDTALTLNKMLEMVRLRNAQIVLLERMI